MSALGDKVHALVTRFTSIGKADVEEIVQALTDHLVPVVKQAFAEAVADEQKIVTEVKVDVKAIASEVAAELAKVLGNTPAPTPAPAPAEPPTAS